MDPISVLPIPGAMSTSGGRDVLPSSGATSTSGARDSVVKGEVHTFKDLNAHFDTNFVNEWASVRQLDHNLDDANRAAVPTSTTFAIGFLKQGASRKTPRQSVLRITVDHGDQGVSSCYPSFVRFDFPSVQRLADYELTDPFSRLETGTCPKDALKSEVFVAHIWWCVLALERITGLADKTGRFVASITKAVKMIHSFDRPQPSATAAHTETTEVIDEAGAAAEVAGQNSPGIDEGAAHAPHQTPPPPDFTQIGDGLKALGNHLSNYQDRTAQLLTSLEVAKQREKSVEEENAKLAEQLHDATEKIDTLRTRLKGRKERLKTAKEDARVWKDKYERLTAALQVIRDVQNETVPSEQA